MKLSIVVPVYNEERTIDQILERIGKTPYEKEIIIVDDYSKDGTREILHQMEICARIPSARFFYHSLNQGKGAALRTGIAAATGDIVELLNDDTEVQPAWADAALNTRVSAASARNLLFMRTPCVDRAARGRLASV